MIRNLKKNLLKKYFKKKLLKKQLKNNENIFSALNIDISRVKKS